MTLIMVIPTNVGVVVAADSRIVVGEKHIDFQEKLFFLDSDPSVVFAFTGTVDFVSTPPPGASIKKWLKTVEREFKGSDIVSIFLKSNWKGKLSKKILKSIAQTFNDALFDYFVTHPDTMLSLSGQDLCRFLIVKFEAITKKTRIGSFLVGTDQDGCPSISDFEIIQFEQADERFIGRYGNVDYIDKYVLSKKAKGRKYLPKFFFPLWDAPKLTRDMTPQSALRIAAALIQATAKTTKTISIESGIGGAPQIFLLDGQNRHRIDRLNKKRQ